MGLTWAALVAVSITVPVNCVHLKTTGVRPMQAKGRSASLRDVVTADEKVTGRAPLTVQSRIIMWQLEKLSLRSVHGFNVPK